MSQNSGHNRSSALGIAWQHFAEFDFNAEEAQNWHRWLRATVIVLGVIATALAVLGEIINNVTEVSIIPEIFRVVLIFVPIAGSLVLAYANKFYPGEYWLALRSGAEEIKKEIYLFRTLLQDQAERHLWLNERVAAIQRQVTEGLGGNLVLKPYLGEIPPYYDPDDENSDPGFRDLMPGDYLRYRLQDQLEWHTNKVGTFEKRRKQLQIWIFVFGGLGTFFAAIGSLVTVLVALTASLAAAVTAWQELNRYDAVISNYNQLIAELKIIHDHWQGLTPKERTGDQFFKLVIATEKVLWSQHSQYIFEMRKAVAELQDESEDTLDQVAKMPASVAIDEAVMAAALASSEEVREKEPSPDLEEKPAEKAAPKQGAPHAFVVMPFGRKQDRNGRWINFDGVYLRLIKPALLEAGFEPFRADEETVSGDILTDMFQELLLADLVIADLSIDNSNVFYELGVRHALRRRGLVHIQSGRDYMPFDIFNVRTIPYYCGDDGLPDPQQLRKDIKTIVEVAQATLSSSSELVHSPIFNLLDGLEEPDRKSLQTPLAMGYWQKHHDWERRIEIARREKRIGDILLLAEEVTNPLLKEDAIAEAGKALAKLGRNDLALEQYEVGLRINPKNVEFRREEAFHLGRLNRTEEAIVKLKSMERENVADSEAIAFLGRLYKDLWCNEWLGEDDKQARLKAAYDASELLKLSIQTYLKAYGMEQSHYYSGINALTLAKLLDFLVKKVGNKDDIDAEVEAIRLRLPSLQGAVQFALDQAAEKEADNFWVFATLADITVLTAEESELVARAYKRALALGGRSKASINSTLQQLELMERLDFRPKFVEAGIGVLETALQRSGRSSKDQADQKLSRAFVFAGHMIDQENRPERRFPPEMEELVRKAIKDRLNELKANKNDVAFTPGASCGGDILFIEACLDRGMKVEVYLPLEIAEFVNKSVSFAGSDWVRRFYKIRQNPDVTFYLQSDQLGSVPEDDNEKFARNNRWTLYSARRFGIEQLEMTVLWDGQPGDGPGGTSHMVEEIRRIGGMVAHIDTAALLQQAKL